MDRPSDIIVSALTDARDHPEGLPLYRIGKHPGLFPSKVIPHGEAAEFILNHGLLEKIKESTSELYRITSRGIAYLEEQQNPKQALESLLTELKTHESHMPIWLADLRSQLQALTQKLNNHIEAQSEKFKQLQSQVVTALQRLSHAGLAANDSSTLFGWQLDIVIELDRRHKAGESRSPLADLFNYLRTQGVASLSVADFHSGLLSLRNRGSIVLHTFAGPMRDLAHPEFALTEGPMVYASASRS